MPGWGELLMQELPLAPTVPLYAPDEQVELPVVIRAAGSVGGDSAKSRVP
jgi:hypothetical protein